jgi:alcohol dehydrogenase class IV
MVIVKPVPFKIPPAIITGIGSVRENLLAEVRNFKAGNILIVSDSIIAGAGYLDELRGYLAQPDLNLETYTEIEPEPSIENMEATLAWCQGKTFDAIIGLGGGSVIDSAKMLSALLAHGGAVRDYVGGPKAFEKRGAPTIMIPTTSGTGAEVTVNVVFKDKAAKLTLVVVSPFLMPDLALVDPLYTLTVPPAVTAATGMDALTHAIEAYTAGKATPMTDLFAEDAIRRIGRSLRTAVTCGPNVEARLDMSLGSLFGGIANAGASVGAVHALSYPLCGEYNLSHGAGNALLMPYVAEINMIGNIPKFARIAELMGEPVGGLSPRQAATRAVEALKQLSVDIEIPLHMSQFGVPKEVLPRWAKTVIETQVRLLSNNPRVLTEKDVLAIYQSAL